MDVYVFENWDDAPGGGYRSALSHVVPERWMSIVDASADCAVASSGYPRVAHNLFVWRLQHGLIGSKATILDVTFGDEPGTARYHNMPIGEEWQNAAWASANSEVWPTGSIRTFVARVGQPMRCDYQGVEVDREGVSRLVEHLRGMAAPVERSKPKPPAEAIWNAWVSDRKARGAVLPSQDVLLIEARGAFADHKITDAMIRAAFGGGKKGPRREGSGKN